MLKFKTSCAVLAYLSSTLLNKVGLSLFRYFEVGLRVCDIVVNKFTFAISSTDEFLYYCPVRQSAHIYPSRPTSGSPLFLLYAADPDGETVSEHRFTQGSGTGSA